MPQLVIILKIEFPSWFPTRGMSNQSEISRMEFLLLQALLQGNTILWGKTDCHTVPLAYPERTSGHCIGTLSITEKHYLNEHKNIIKKLNIVYSNIYPEREHKHDTNTYTWKGSSYHLISKLKKSNSFFTYIMISMKPLLLKGPKSVCTCGTMSTHFLSLFTFLMG